MTPRRSWPRRFSSSPLLVAIAGLAVLLSLPPGALASPSSHSSTAALTPSVTATATTNLGWTSLTPGLGPSPLLRYSAGLAFDGADGYAVLFGGCNRHLCPLGDTWKFEAGAWTNLTSSLAQSPAPRQGELLVYDVRDGYLLLFGGQGAAGMLNDSWKFAGGAWSPISGAGPSPSARAFAQATYDPTLGVVLFGGRDGAGTLLDDTWSFAGGVWTNLSDRYALAPVARASGGLAFDPSDGVTVLFGGVNSAGAYLGDTWALSSTGWANLTSVAGTAPLPRANATLTSDPGRSSAVLVGGWNGVALPDTWAFSNDSWQPITANLTNSPGARYGAVAAYYSEGGYLLLFGGITAGGRYNTWLLLSPLQALVAGPSGSVAPGVPATFSANVTGGLGPYNETWAFGDGSAPEAGTPATHTFSLAGTYTVSVTASDADANLVTAVTTITIRATPLTVAIVPSASTGSVNSPVQLTAEALGGVAPYVYAWSAPAGICGDTRVADLACTPVATGPIQFTVTVTDASGQSATTGFTLPVTGPTGGSATAPNPTTPTTALGGHANGWLVVIPVAAALVGAVAIGVMMYVAGRRKARAQFAQRPLCYAVPAWSETPPEFVSGDGSERDR